MAQKLLKKFEGDAFGHGADKQRWTDRKLSKTFWTFSKQIHFLKVAEALTQCCNGLLSTFDAVSKLLFRLRRLWFPSVRVRPRLSEKTS